MKDPWQIFNFNKTVQAVHYLVRELGLTDSRKLSVLTYFTDRYHVRRCGIGITGDDYKATKSGTVGSSTINLLTGDPAFFNTRASGDRSYLQQLLMIYQSEVAINERCGYDELSRSEQEALGFVLQEFGDFDQVALTEITRDYPEWKRFRTMLGRKAKRAADEDYIDFLEDPDLSDSPGLHIHFGGVDPFRQDRRTLDAIKELLLKKE